MSATSSLIIPATAEHTATVILIHASTLPHWFQFCHNCSSQGLGGSAEGFSYIAKTMSKDLALSEVKWILPNAYSPWPGLSSL